MKMLHWSWGKTQRGERCHARKVAELARVAPLATRRNMLGVMDRGRSGRRNDIFPVSGGMMVDGFFVSAVGKNYTRF